MPQARNQTVRPSRLAITTQIVEGGVGITGLTVNAAIHRRSDAKWYDNTVGWNAGFSVRPMIEIDATNMPGMYSLILPANHVDENLALDGYEVKFIETTRSHLEYLDVSVTAEPAEVWREKLRDFLSTNAADAALHVGPQPGGTTDEMALILWSLKEAVLRTTFNGADAVVHFQADANGTTVKFYHMGVKPVAADNAEWTGAEGVFIDKSTGDHLRVLVTGIANDGDEHFSLTLADGSALPNATAIGDQLVLARVSGGLTANELMEHPMAAHATIGTFGDGIRRMLGLRQSNMRVVYTAWSSDNQPTAGYVLIYDSSADRSTDTGPGWALATGRYDFAATYNGSLQLTEYVSDRTS